MTVLTVKIRPFINTDYRQLKHLYKESGWFDAETDSKEQIAREIENDPESVLVALRGNQIVGTVSLLYTLRLALFFRLVVQKHKDSSVLTELLLKKGEELLKRRGYKEVHILAPEGDRDRHKAYKRYGFEKGKCYRWFWKKVD